MSHLSSRAGRYNAPCFWCTPATTMEWPWTNSNYGGGLCGWWVWAGSDWRITSISEATITRIPEDWRSWGCDNYLLVLMVDEETSHTWGKCSPIDCCLLSILATAANHAQVQPYRMVDRQEINRPDGENLKQVLWSLTSRSLKLAQVGNNGGMRLPQSMSTVWTYPEILEELSFSIDQGKPMKWLMKLLYF